MSKRGVKKLYTPEEAHARNLESYRRSYHKRKEQLQPTWLQIYRNQVANKEYKYTTHLSKQRDLLKEASPGESTSSSSDESSYS
jgi:putative protein kinase ArgK-like GTPase of G3E family